jgi:hypothetical protein
VGPYLPRQGDFVALTFDPQSGHEQKGRRPALVISHDLFNKHTGMAIACPITRTDRHMARMGLPPASGGYNPATDFSAIRWGRTLEEALAWYVETSRRIQAVIPELRAPVFEVSLRAIAARRGHVLRQPRLLYHEDLGNFCVCADRLSGFFDLEMCRLGCEALQLGVALRLCEESGLPWRSLQAGYQEASGQRLAEEDLGAAKAMRDFYYWIRICRWGWWDGSAQATEHIQAVRKDLSHYAMELGRNPPEGSL